MITNIKNISKPEKKKNSFWLWHYLLPQLFRARYREIRERWVKEHMRKTFLNVNFEATDKWLRFSKKKYEEAYVNEFVNNSANNSEKLLSLVHKARIKKQQRAIGNSQRLLLIKRTEKKIAKLDWLFWGKIQQSYFWFLLDLLLNMHPTCFQSNNSLDLSAAYQKLTFNITDAKIAIKLYEEMLGQVSKNEKEDMPAWIQTKLANLVLRVQDNSKAPVIENFSQNLESVIEYSPQYLESDQEGYRAKSQTVLPQLKNFLWAASSWDPRYDNDLLIYRYFLSLHKRTKNIRMGDTTHNSWLKFFSIMHKNPGIISSIDEEKRNPVWYYYLDLKSLVMSEFLGNGPTKKTTYHKSKAEVKSDKWRLDTDFFIRKVSLKRSMKFKDFNSLNVDETLNNHVKNLIDLDVDDSVLTNKFNSLLCNKCCTITSCFCKNMLNIYVSTEPTKKVVLKKKTKKVTKLLFPIDWMKRHPGQDIFTAIKEK